MRGTPPRLRLATLIKPADSDKNDLALAG